MRPAILGAISSSSQSIGGVQIGAAGTGIYDGFILSAGEEFRSLDLASSVNPSGKYMTTRAYRGSGSPGAGMRAPPSGPLAVMHDVDPTYSGWQDANRGLPVVTDSHTIVDGEGTGALRLKAIRQSAGEQTKLATGVSGQIERAAMIHTAGALWFDGPCIVEWRARLPPGPAGQHPTLWGLSVTPPGGPNFTGNEWGFEGSGENQTAYHLAWTNASTSSSSQNIGASYHDGDWSTFRVNISATDYKFYADDTLRHTAAVDPDDRGDKPDYLLISNHVYNSTFMAEDYSAAAWAAATDGVVIDVEWFRVWRPAGGAHYQPRASLPDVLTSVGGAVNVVLPSQSELWGATGLTEYVCALPIEVEEPGGSNSTSYGQFPAGLSYDSGTRTLSGTMPAQAGGLYIAVGVVAAGSTCQPARFRLCSAPIYGGAGSFSFQLGVSVSIDVYAAWSVGRLFQSGDNPKGLSVSGLPAGLSFSAATGLITGTPTGTGSGTLSISCTNSAGQTVSTSPTYVTTDPAAGIPAPTLTGGLTPVASWDFANPGLVTASDAIDAVAGADGTSYSLSGSGGTRPTLESRNSKNAARFALASGQYLQLASDLGQSSNSTGLTLVAVLEHATVAAQQGILDIANGASAANRNRYVLQGAIAGVGWVMRKAAGVQESDANDGTAFTTGRHLLVGVAKAGTSGCELNVDGVATPDTSVQSSAQPTGLTHTTMGARRVSGVNGNSPFDGWIWRVLVYVGELTTTQREEIAVWAATNYGTANNA